jgi:hypothetical protein
MGRAERKEQLSAISRQLSAISYQLSAVSFKKNEQVGASASMHWKFF